MERGVAIATFTDTRKLAAGEVFAVYAGTGGHTMYLPSASAYGARVPMVVYVSHAGAGTLTIAALAGETTLTTSVALGDTVLFISDGNVTWRAFEIEPPSANTSPAALAFGGADFDPSDLTDVGFPAPGPTAAPGARGTDGAPGMDADPPEEPLVLAIPGPPGPPGQMGPPGMAWLDGEPPEEPIIARTGLITPAGGSNEPDEKGEILPQPEAQVNGNATRADQTSLAGASYVLYRRTTFNRIIFRTTTGILGGTVKVLIYQAPGGLSGTANLIASASVAVTTLASNYSATPNEGTVQLAPGLFYVLYGRDSVGGSFTMRTYAVNNADLLTGMMDANTHPCVFTTAVAANTSPATFDPIATPTASSTDIPMIVRLRKV